MQAGGRVQQGVRVQVLFLWLPSAMGETARQDHQLRVKTRKAWGGSRNSLILCAGLRDAVALPPGRYRSWICRETGQRGCVSPCSPLRRRGHRTEPGRGLRESISPGRLLSEGCKCHDGPQKSRWVRSEATVWGDEGLWGGGRLSHLQALGRDWLSDLGTTESELNRCDVGLTERDGWN